MTSINYSKIQINNYSKIHNGNDYPPSTTFLNQNNRTVATHNKTVQFILSNARYFFLPVASFFDFLHSLTGIREDDYKNKKYFILSLHCTVWLQISILLTAFSSLAMFNPILIELVNLQNKQSLLLKRQYGVFELLANLPPYGYIQKFMFFQLFCFCHTVLVVIGFKTNLPIYFAPSQIALLMFIVKLLIGFVKDIWFIMNDSLISFQRLTHGSYQVSRYYIPETEIQFALFDNEILPIVSAVIYVLFFISVISFEYIIERSMQYMKYEYFITDTENYVREVIRLRFEKAQEQQGFYPDHPVTQYSHSVNQYPYPENQYHHPEKQYPHLTRNSEVDVELE